MTRVFMDTVGIIALLDEDDQWHLAAEEAYATLRSAKGVPVTTEHILLECGNASARRPYRRDIADLRKAFQESDRLLTVTADDEAEAWRAYADGVPGDAGVVDNISFIAMRRHGIQQAFTNDKHFQAEGFETLF